jgi:hypothetical protein
MRRSAAIGIAALIAVMGCLSAAANNIIDDPIKWIQLPDMDTGLDIQSQWNPQNQDPDDGTYNPDVIKADDWICNGLPIVDIHWWGSYVNNEEVAVTGFWINFYDNDMGGAGIADDKPGGLLQSWFVDFGSANETLYGDDQNPTTHLPPDDYEHVYLYSFYLPEGEWFYQQEGAKYWLSIVAVTPDVLGSAPMWGWHTGFEPATLDTTNAVTGKVQAYSLVGEGNPLEWAHMEYDMAFALTTVPEPQTYALVGAGVLGLLVLRRRKQK